MRVRVIGGGITASSFCNRLLELLPHADIVVSETGRSSGGRCSERPFNNQSAITHGCPSFDVRSSSFQKIVDNVLVPSELVVPWQPCRLASLNAETASLAMVPDGTHTLYKQTPKLFKHLMTDRVQFQANTKISKITVTSASKWQLNEEPAAHDADWLVVTSPVVAHPTRWRNNFSVGVVDEDPPLCAALARIDQENLPALTAMASLKSRPVNSLLTVFSCEAAQQMQRNLPFEMAHVEKSPILGKIVCQGMTDDGFFPVVAHSTSSFADSNELSNTKKSAQHEVAKTLMEEAMASCLAPWIDVTNASIAYSAIHRWGAAFPVIHPFFENDLSFVNPKTKLAICGDFFSQNPGRVETAFQSGWDAAEAIALAESS